MFYFYFLALYNIVRLLYVLICIIILLLKSINMATLQSLLILIFPFIKNYLIMGQPFSQSLLSFETMNFTPYDYLINILFILIRACDTVLYIISF